MKALMGTLGKEVVGAVTCWELKSHLFEALVFPTFTYGIEIWGGHLKNPHWKVFKTGMKGGYDVSHQSLFFSFVSYFGELPMELYGLKLTTGCQQHLTHLSPSWLVNMATSLS